MRPSERDAGAPSSISAISHDVPPISTVIRSRKPAVPPTILAPITPAAGPERTTRTDRGRPAHDPRPSQAGSRTGEEKPNRTQPRRGRRANSAARLHDLKGCADRRGEETGIQIGEIAVDHGFNIGIKRRDDSALVFAEGRIDLGRERDEYVRM